MPILLKIGVFYGKIGGFYEIKNTNRVLTGPEGAFA